MSGMTHHTRRPQLGLPMPEGWGRRTPWRSAGLRRARQGSERLVDGGKVFFALAEFHRAVQALEQRPRKRGTHPGIVRDVNERLRPCGPRVYGRITRGDIVGGDAVRHPFDETVLERSAQGEELLEGNGLGGARAIAWKSTTEQPAESSSAA